MKYLITGGCGFIGSNLAAEVLNRGEELVVLDNLFRHGSGQNLEWLKKKGNFIYYPFDIRNYNDVETVVQKEKPDVVFHLAGQVAMTTSISNPRLDFETNTLGTHNLLEAIRRYQPNAMILYSSTNKVYGDFDYLTFDETDTRYICKEFPHGFDESIQLNFHSPYGCSKGAADQYLMDYARIYGLKTVVFRHSSMYGGNQHATYDQGWIGWFCQKALEIKNGTAEEPFTISGNGKQVRDVLHADDVVNLYFASVNQIDQIKGQAFNIGGGIDYSLSLLELFMLLEDILGIKMTYKQLPPRESDQLVFVADNTKITNLIGWKPKVEAKGGLIKMLEWLS
ncbi:GDP-mannose 4,6-dehydratase [Draconibacterium halophilum]|uniref:NAD-dependent epimerase/dehydratase family protein n=1 Tax=Draconibacterium halophilum TaxID=2706887 RepID=A0A6C0R9T6_9BACT|nr:GDP-mannose 4,6-dehydratase [Draconibacterium halophilum]QIA06716.1 NAD-dependent epimerase/dehydratase family protein [Draconibacterium halophilum]